MRPGYTHSSPGRDERSLRPVGPLRATRSQPDFTRLLRRRAPDPGRDGSSTPGIDITATRNGSQPDAYEPNDIAGAASPLALGVTKLATTDTVSTGTGTGFKRPRTPATSWRRVSWREHRADPGGRRLLVADSTGDLRSLEPRRAKRIAGRARARPKQLVPYCEAGPGAASMWRLRNERRVEARLTRFAFSDRRRIRVVAGCIRPLPQLRLE
jgi:hypothetical protein